MQATIRLFKAVPVEQKIKIKDPDPVLLTKTVRRGFVFAPEVWGNYNDTEIEKLIEMVEKEVGLTPEQMNSSFHKSWEKVANAPLLQLVLEQIVHYMTTYGYERLGVYDEDTVYIPYEQLDIPETERSIKLVVIKGYEKAELKEKLLKFLGSGIALKDETIKDAVDVALFTELTGVEIENTKNKEVKSRLYDLLNMVPKNPVEFLRHCIYRSTGRSLLIKDRMTLEAIKEKDNLGVLGLFRIYKNSYGLEGLAEIFLRFKPLFLAFRGNHEMNKTINKIRKLAVKHHKPMPIDILNDVTAILKSGATNGPWLKKLDTAMAKANTFRKIRLAYALNFRARGVDSILYRIRNGKSYATEFNFPYPAAAHTLMNHVLNSVCEDVSKNVSGKKIYIPEHVRYTLPATEKMFTGDLPSGTAILVPQDMIFGIHWTNPQGHRIDLDLSVTSPSTGKIGWDGGYRTRERDILFSGDNTDAPRPRGASELFYVGNVKPNDLIMHVNYYNFRDDVPVPFKIMVGMDTPRDWGTNYMLNQNNVLGIAKTEINQRQKVLGLARSTLNGCEFIFAEAYLGNSITSHGAPYNEWTRKYLFNFYTNTISLNDVLARAGAILVDNREDADIDLSMETLEKDTIVGLLV